MRSKQVIDLTTAICVEPFVKKAVDRLIELTGLPWRLIIEQEKWNMTITFETTIEGNSWRWQIPSIDMSRVEDVHAIELAILSQFDNVITLANTEKDRRRQAKANDN